jgi:hypothetical protein
MRKRVLERFRKRLIREGPDPSSITLDASELLSTGQPGRETLSAERTMHTGGDGINYLWKAKMSSA